MPITLNLALLVLVMAAALLAGMMLRARQKRQEELAQDFPQKDELTIALARAQDLAENRMALLTDMSHELRTPMNGVIGYTDILLQSDLDAEQRQNVGVIADAGRMMVRIIDDILENARADNDHGRLAADPVDIATLLSDCTALLQPLARAKGLALGVWVDDAVPEHLALDRQRVRQVLSNIVGNAIKFTDSGAIDVEARVENTTDGAHLLITVIDTGIGIAADKLAVILQPYQQADKNIASKYGGNGLGLAISNRLVGLMGGQLVVQSKPEIGSSFTIRLPLRPCPAPTPQRTAPASHSNTLLRGRRLLVVEDDELSSHVVEALCHKMGIETVAVTTGEAALAVLDKARHDHTRFDAVLLDVHLPGIGGVETAQRIRAKPDYRSSDLPIIALTASAEKIGYRRAGFHAHLSKPLTSIALARELALCLVKA